MKSGRSLSTKIILMVEAILLLSGAIFCGISISRSQAGIRRAIRQRMVDIANCAAGSVNGNILKSLKPGDEGTPGYRTVYDTMAVFRDNAELEYIYAIRDEGNGQFTFIVDTDPDDPGEFGEEVHYTEALNTASKGKTAVDEAPYSDQWGEFYSAYSPVFDSSGQVAGIVAADFSVAWYDAQLQEQTMSNIKGIIIVLCAMLLGAAVLCLVIIRPYVKQQEQLLEEKVTAESANQAKSEFLANMSHEIRTPINAVLGMNEMIQRESRQGRELPAGKTEEAGEAFDRIGFYAGEVDSAGRSLLTIINDILDFSKIEAGKMELIKVRYRLSTVLDEVSNMISFKAREKGLEFSIDADKAIPDNLFGDEVRIREIITNILTNAVKYTERGFVRLTVRAGEQAGNTVPLVFTAEDSGIGIRQEDMDRLFTKFERLDMQRNSTIEGSGLGLVITRSLLDLMGGTIDVQSEYGKGSVFTITIPQRVASEDLPDEVQISTAERTDCRETFHAPDARVLVVDDTKMNLTVTVSLLKDTKIQIDTASCGADAVAMAEKKHYDVIFMDQRMPEMDGTETLRGIRRQQDGPNANTPVICLTADAIIGAKERYLAEGFSDYLAKPVNSRNLEAMLLKYLPAEKVMPVSAAEKEDQDAKESARTADNDGYEPLREAGIEPGDGLFYCQGDEELYRTLLAEYIAEYPGKSDEIRRCFEAKDWKNYGIFVHSLKSSSRMLGAKDLSETAARLEAAANAKDEETILREHGRMMAGYEAVARAVRNTVQAPEPETEQDVFEFEPEETEQ